ncbi:MAG: phosphoenolpyruvate synthase [Anaerolineae bacterium]
MSRFILPFSKISASNIGEVGGKGANLGELTQAGFNVPGGFCVTTSAFERFMAEAAEDVYVTLDQDGLNDLDLLRQVGTTVRSELTKIDLPADIQTELLAAWRESGEELAYAIRSSATAEDLPHASFAGQQDTYLNVRGADELIVKVKACFISLFTDRAILYRVQNNFDHRQVALSVVVQQMVQPEVAGILFTADPITGHRHIASIDARFGLGEALVSGLVSADLYQVDKRTAEITKRQIATKKMAIRSLPQGGTEEVQLGPDESDLPALNDQQIVELARLGTKIEKHYGRPQDIEWALVGDDLFITQSRPITSLFPLPPQNKNDDALHVYASLSHFQVMTDAMPHLSYSMLASFLPLGRTAGKAESSYVHLVGNRVYVDASSVLRHPIGRRLLVKAFNNADQLAQLALKELGDRAEFQVHGTRYNPLKVIPVLRPYIFKALRMMVSGEPVGETERTSDFMQQHVATIKNKLEQTPDLAQQLDVIVDELHDAINVISTWAPYAMAGMIASNLQKVVLRLVGEPDEIAALERGLSGNVVTEMNLALGDLADLARQSADLPTLLKRTDIDGFQKLSLAADCQGAEPFLNGWQAFLERYGARALSEIDLHRPRWSEDPSALLQMVTNSLTASQPGAHRVHYEKLADECEQAAQSLGEKASKGLFCFVRGPIARRLIKVSRNLSPLREHHKFMVIQLFALFKPIFIEAGEFLAAEGALAAPDDVWFLTLTELVEAVKRPDASMLSTIKERQESFDQVQEMTPPRVMTSDGEIPIVKLDGGNAPKGALIGSPVSAGVVEGIAKVVLDPSTESLKSGEILVAPFTDPGWTPLFVNAAGLITEVGGLMTHGSVVAREYGIPAVVGVVDATKQIKTGQRVRVHGDVGYIELLDDLPEVDER